jgi:hypothetical protein
MEEAFREKLFVPIKSAELFEWKIWVSAFVCDGILAPYYGGQHSDASLDTNLFLPDNPPIAF